MSEDLRPQDYFANRANADMEKHLKPKQRTLRETLAAAARIIALHEEDAGLAGQISARSDKPEHYWTLKFGLGFEEATPEDFIEVDKDLNTTTGDGMANPATRFHLWVYAARPDVNSITHTHSPWVSALAASGKPLIPCQMDMTPFYDDCAFLPRWPGLPIADQEGVIISKALGQNRSIILVNHGQLTTGVSIQEATYLSVYLERAARLQMRASIYGEPKKVPRELALPAHDYLLKPRVVHATFDYWDRKADKAYGPLLAQKTEV
ncbi:Ribulose-5-phosphate 4-epimerase [Leptodontidium sp. 2 PMI_412]|nr:Ribulose-5-phosphate 4-epimerase [Leptodontidium sp. 2 PMI_412]